MICVQPKTALALLCVWLVPSLALAQSNQSPRVDVAAGYERLRGPQAETASSMFVAVEGTYREWLGVVGEFSSNSAFLAGPRLTFRKIHGVVAFGQLLAGVGRSGDDHQGDPALFIQPSAGVDVAVHPHVKLRLGADCRELSVAGAAGGPIVRQAFFRAGLVVY